MAATLRFLAAPGVLIDDYDALMASPPSMRKLGVRMEEVAPGRHAFVPTGEAFEVSKRGEYAKHARAGELLPADAETAAYCGVPFTPPAVKAKKADAPNVVKES